MGNKRNKPLAWCCAAAVLLAACSSGGSRPADDPAPSVVQREAFEGVEDMRAVSAALDTIARLSDDLSQDTTLIERSSWNSEWADAWGVIFRNFKSGKLHEAAAYCLAYADTKNALDFANCGVLMVQWTEEVGISSP